MYDVCFFFKFSTAQMIMLLIIICQKSIANIDTNSLLMILLFSQTIKFTHIQRSQYHTIQLACLFN